jgi:LDH2 family malate/lactate/ureidoglycolate dehydrogenase
MIVSGTDLKTRVREILIRAGTTEANANCVASHLVNSNLCGVDTHGVWQLPGYVAAIERNELLPAATPELLDDTPTSVLVTGRWGFGQVAALEAIQQGLRKAQSSGVAVIGVVQSHHIGRLGEYVELAARLGFIAMIWISGLGEEKPTVVPHGGTKPIFGTNPLAIGLPVANEHPITVDFATSATSGVKIIEAIRKGKSLAPGLIVDKHGVTTSDPHELEHGGGQISFGGHKGYALTLATEVLGRIFVGADTLVEPPRGGYPFSHQGATMIVMRSDLFQPSKSYLERTSELQTRIRAVPPASGFEQVNLPGDPEARTRAIRERDGIPIPDDLWETLTALASHPGNTSAASEPQPVNNHGRYR